MSILPAEVEFTDLEREFMENEPPGLFPQNQDSYWGQLRKVTSDALQEVADLLAAYYLNQSVDTVNADDMTEWETQFGIAAGTRTLEQRRSFVKSRLTAGPFTRARRKAIIESFVVATFGVPITFVPGGIPFDAGGIPFFGEASTLAGTYRVYEDIQGFTYAVWIKNTTVPDIAGLTRELARITPSGIVFAIDNAHADVLDYFKLVRNSQPVGYWRLGTINDSAAPAHNLTAAGGVVAGSSAAPGLLNANVAGGEGATVFDGVDDAFSITDAASGGALDFSGQKAYTLEAWVLPNVLDAGLRRIVAKGNGVDEYNLLGNSVTGFRFERWVGGAVLSCAYLPAVPNALHHVVGVYTGLQLKLYVDGVLRQTVADARSAIDNASDFAIGRQPGGAGTFWKGTIDEVTVYNLALDDLTILDHYNTGRDIATY
jgi:hypothetical protein